MRKRHNDQKSDEPPRKKSFVIPNPNHEDIDTGEILTDLSGKKWKLGIPIGLGGFGVIHEITEIGSSENDKYVVKIESHNSGPLFTEINCYLRIGREEMIEEWKTKKGLCTLGMPIYTASGSHIFKDNKYRFLVLPRYGKDLEMILQEKKKFNLKTVLLISSRILQILEYIHNKGYIHSDIKAANILVGQVKQQKNNESSQQKLSVYSKSPVSDLRSRYPKLRTCKVRKLSEKRYPSVPKPYAIRAIKNINYNDDLFLSDLTPLLDPIIMRNEDKRNKMKKEYINQDEQLYLLDFGLASKYKLSNGEHKTCEDERKAHAGTLLFCSRDAHRGMQSRRSDLESLAYNMVYWLTGSLPWIDDLENPEMIQRKKRHCFIDTSGFLHICMPDPPRILNEFFHYIKNLNVQDAPNYDACQQFIKKALRDRGYEDDGKFDFHNEEGWKVPRKPVPRLLLDELKRPPLLSNMPVKPILRKKIKSKKTAAAVYWSRMLSNPEVLLKKVRERKTGDNEVCLPVLDFNIDNMNPTPAMREVYQKYQERKGLSPKSNEDYLEGYPDGYTSAMVAVWQKAMEQKAMEEDVRPVRKGRKSKKSRASVTINNSGEPSKLKSKTSHRTGSYCLRG